MSAVSFRHVLAASLLLAASTRLAAAQAQTGTVSGTVTGEIGQPIAGAQVALVGTGLGTLTNPNGKYTIVNVPAGAVPRARADDRASSDRESGDRHRRANQPRKTSCSSKQVIALDAIVVTGTAGAARQREVGNSVSQIDMAKVNEPPANIGQLLQGRTTGMTVMPSSAGQAAAR